MTVDSFDIVFYTAVFVLPGFIMNSIIDATNPPKKYNEGIYFLKCIFLSIISCAIFSWLYAIVIECDKLATVLYWIILIAISTIGSSLLGFGIAIIKQKHTIDWLLSKMKIKTIHTTPTAWDYYFSSQKSSFIIVTLTDDTKLYGWYSTNSFTSSDSEERDIYIEKGYRYSDDNGWVEDKHSDGFYIPKEQIKYIEFKHQGEKNE